MFDAVATAYFGVKDWWYRPWYSGLGTTRDGPIQFFWLK